MDQIFLTVHNKIYPPSHTKFQHKTFKRIYSKPKPKTLSNFHQTETHQHRNTSLPRNKIGPSSACSK